MTAGRYEYSCPGMEREHHMTRLEELLSRSNFRLPSPPSIALRLLEILKKDNFTFTEIAQIIQYDPALTAKVLKAVNSPYYSLPNRVSSIEQALVVMGVHVVKNIVFSFTLVSALKFNEKQNFNIDYFWKRSIIAAIATELFTEHFNIRNNDLFVTALLQDLGILILHSNFLDEYSELIERKNTVRLPIEVLEEEKYGFNHQELCSEILKRWGLSESVYIPIRYHHRYGNAPEQYRHTARILYLSNALSSIYSDTESCDTIKHYSGVIRNDLSISDSDLEALVDRGGKKVIEICSSFEISAENIKPLAILLQEANEGLSDLNLSYERLLEEYRKEKLQAQTLAEELQIAYEKLKDAVNLDYLTGLYNRRYLFDFLEQEVNRTKACGDSLAIIIFDVDFFKKINDTHGHKVGDNVLKAISAKARAIKGDTGLLARYGGEEFIVVMPRTELRKAVAMGERLRKGIEELSVPIRGQVVKATISAGVAAWDSPTDSRSITRLLDLADKALYRAKNTGRNRVVTAHR